VVTSEAGTSALKRNPEINYCAVVNGLLDHENLHDLSRIEAKEGEIALIRDSAWA